MKPKLGRPKLPKDQARGILVGARFSASEARQVVDAAKRSKLSKSEWVRKVLLSAAKDV